MKISFFLRSLLILILIPVFSNHKMEEPDYKKTCLSPEELKLYNLINTYRKAKKLPAIPLSKCLSFVAQTHSKDLMVNRPDKGNCNGHSWSNKGKWSSCCYTPDHKQSECMWNKPKELTSYTDIGFEIAYMSSNGVEAEEALNGWKKSPGHNSVLINSGTWKSRKWKSIGIGIYGNYATVWFGSSEDAEGAPGKCENK